ncbi:MAG TPA: hypothetical protein VLG27_04615 [Candidatus Saccharimonadia bacterium]|nr:hypothetical protein [Candidatus Saccharimonadia bacterium]
MSETRERGLVSVTDPGFERGNVLRLPLPAAIYFTPYAVDEHPDQTDGVQPDNVTDMSITAYAKRLAGLNPAVDPVKTELGGFSPEPGREKHYIPPGAYDPALGSSFYLTHLLESSRPERGFRTPAINLEASQHGLIDGLPQQRRVHESSDTAPKLPPGLGKLLVGNFAKRKLSPSDPREICA